VSASPASAAGFDIAGAGNEQVADATTPTARFDLRLDFGGGRKAIGRRRERLAALRVEPRHQVILEGVGLRLVGHQADRRRASETGDECSAIEFHMVLPHSR
jgi:hypothetical protein